MSLKCKTDPLQPQQTDIKVKKTLLTKTGKSVKKLCARTIISQVKTRLTA